MKILWEILGYAPCGAYLGDRPVFKAIIWGIQPATKALLVASTTCLVKIGGFELAVCWGVDDVFDLTPKSMAFRRGEEQFYLEFCGEK